MKLLRIQSEKQRSVYQLEDRIRKYWHISKLEWASTHFELLNDTIPGYTLGIGHNNDSVWIDYKIISGVPASTLPHSLEFMEKIYQFCLANIEETKPYAHGDWSLSNMLIDDDVINMCDWDNLGIYPADEVYKKLNQDLLDSFGSSFLKLIK